MRGAITIPLPTPFSVPRTLSFLRTSSLRTPYHFVGAHRVRRLVRLDGRPSVVEFGFAPPGARLRVRAVGPVEGPGLASALRRLATSVWSLDDDLRRCYAALRRDPLMAPLLKHCAGLRMIRTPDLYEALLIAIIGQQVSVAAAESIRRRLITTLGDRAVREGMTYAGYPPPRRLLRTSPAGLRAVGLSRQKARYVLEIADREVAGVLAPAAFDGLPDEQAIARLIEIPGVGRWTAEIVLMRGLGRPDVFPAADLGLGLAVQRLLGRRTRPTEDALRALADRWMGWRSYGALYLWRSLGIAA
ncbi:MAG TPA: DNA-3-methyladenine glycosylase [bacterium]|nr:DNA-3-methyladenine glycosylase [bacterium]